MIRIPAQNEMDKIRSLFIEYQKWLGIDLCFQNFEAELVNLPGEYSEPKGSIFVVEESKSVFVGCIALRPYSNEVAEIKRLYIQPSSQGKGYGILLLERALDMAKAAGYKKVILDTLPTMERARNLYRVFGFTQIGAYYNNPLDDVEYYEKVLS